MQINLEKVMFLKSFVISVICLEVNCVDGDDIYELDTWVSTSKPDLRFDRKNVHATKSFWTFSIKLPLILSLRRKLNVLSNHRFGNRLPFTKPTRTGLDGFHNRRRWYGTRQPPCSSCHALRQRASRPQSKNVINFGWLGEKKRPQLEEKRNERKDELKAPSERLSAYYIK
ncbi:uncharacterized protein LOC128677833 isoform X3 [Plodia interpunctella]|uniref:uncharacterized protein LOC128677833 isoform X3 n=1 Tax=Plodia interpunctella TaxID=58824 RepID=UPI0023682725|nr:uncharacterized protein LOC128677833 isoform X3 [Plodia interpunctella]